MPSTNRRGLEPVYFVYFFLHAFVLLLVDLDPFYPDVLWRDAHAPLGFLGRIRLWYWRTLRDQFFAPAPVVQPRYWDLFAVWELLLHVPVTAWGLATLRPRGRRLVGADELLLLVYGLETLFTTATLMYEGVGWGEDVITPTQKFIVIGVLYGIYLAVAVLLSTDMYRRLLRRLRDESGAGKKAQ